MMWVLSGNASRQDSFHSGQSLKLAPGYGVHTADNAAH